MADTNHDAARFDTLALPAVHASHAGCWLSDRDGAIRTVVRGEAILAASQSPLLMLNAPLVANRLGYPELSGLDLLELFAFIYPARFLVPTPHGLAETLGLPAPQGDADVPRLLAQAAGVLFAASQRDDWAERAGAWAVLQSLSRLHWPWAGLLARHVKRPDRAEPWLFGRLPQWEDRAPRPAPASIIPDTGAIANRLDSLTGAGAEVREGQRHYATASAHIFAPRPALGQPNMLLAQAGTGIGKTLGYLAAASVWSQSAGGTVWVSTYTKALQRQLRRESRRAWPDPTGLLSPASSAKRLAGQAIDATDNVPQSSLADATQQESQAAETPAVVVRKGRENYLCLLNLEDALQGGYSGRAGIFAQMIARWAAFTEDGDMIGGDLPGWLPTLYQRRGLAALTDRRGECVYAACPHYRKCFIERAARQSAHADLVIANHALVMVHAARGSGNGEDAEQRVRPSRIIFDEGHHLFDAADATFAAALCASEAIEMRRWIIGPEGKAKGRRRGLAARLADLASYDEEGGAAIRLAGEAAQALPADGWLTRIVEENPLGPVEELLGAVREVTLARDVKGQDAGYGLETEAADLPAGFIAAAVMAHKALSELRRPLQDLARRLEAVLTDPPDWLDGQGRQRLDGARHSLAWRIDTLVAWEAMLDRIGGPADEDFVDWLAVERGDGRIYDVAIHRRWLDPMRPFASSVLKPAHGVMQTSATLCGRLDPAQSALDWPGALRRSGAAYLDVVPKLLEATSPFDYENQAEVIIVTDVRRGDIAGLAAAYGQLIEASRGGVLGLFTAIRRLRAVHDRIADRLARGGLPLYAQHVDPIDTGTLVDIFRDDPHASLLGTDALRDGVDVPGQSLRLVVMEQVPWPKPSILHRARRAAHAADETRLARQDYDDGIARARLAQAFGRLIRTRQDHGRFVVLSAAFPSRLLSAFPQGTPVRRIALHEALQLVSGGVSSPDAEVSSVQEIDA
ncbi:ATP-dependent DNA helicase [Croceicoccus sp. F390]|uniref:ATP-dependent DNA helicase n=1 Tax=Croceicoccus esteveae TaxID=3075597 RepID=A0ABU2ZEM4_9SPHN|nr:ATP-dependent DNA helicase [Croceicoccus sp. F390]MDT0575052.1 ATP-dependent DNA helicase [Croceicoccus sp. F390]